VVVLKHGRGWPFLGDSRQLIHGGFSNSMVVLFLEYYTRLFNHPCLANLLHVDKAPPTIQAPDRASSVVRSH